MRRLVSILLVVCFAGMGSGVFRFAHDATHAAEDARVGMAAGPSQAHPDPGNVPHEPSSNLPHPRHDETNCSVHALLSAPLLHAVIVPLLICAGLFVAFLTLLAPQPVSRRPVSRLDCRGPPASGF